MNYRQFLLFCYTRFNVYIEIVPALASEANSIRPDLRTVESFCLSFRFEAIKHCSSTRQLIGFRIG